VQTIKKVEQLAQRQEELETESAQTKRKLADAQKYQKELEEREVTLNAEYISLLEKQKSGTQERINVKDLEEKVSRLTTQVDEIDTENKLLQVKIDSANLNVGNFVHDLSILLDQHEQSNAINHMMDVEESVGGDYEYEDDEEGVGAEDEGRANVNNNHHHTSGGGGGLENTVWNAADLVTEYDEQRPHAGTGGSSKIRSRPNNFSQVQPHPQQQLPVSSLTPGGGQSNVGGEPYSRGAP
jgi:hypothetical protein